MEEATSKEKMLKRVRNALIAKSSSPFPDTEMDSPVYQPFEDDPEVVFAREFTRLGGQFVYCETDEEAYITLQLVAAANHLFPLFCRENKLITSMQQFGISVTTDETKLYDMRAAVTSCEYLISRFGSIMVSSRTGIGRKLHCYPEVHVVIAYTWQIVAEMRTALAGMRERYGKTLPSMITLISGPSRTADIEKTLVMGAHGPRELYLFLIEQQKPNSEKNEP